MSYAPLTSDVFDVFNAIRERLKDADIHFSTTSYRDDAISLLVNVPGEYWEIDVLRDGSVDVEVYASRGISDDPLGAIDALICRETDPTTPERI